MAKIGGQVIPGKTVFLLTTELLLTVTGLMLATAIRMFPSSEWWYFISLPDNLGERSGRGAKMDRRENDSQLPTQCFP